MVAGDSPKAASGSSIDLGSGTIPGSMITRTFPSRTKPTVDATRSTVEVVLSFAYPLKRVCTSADEAPGRSLSVAIFHISFLATGILHSLNNVLSYAGHTATPLLYVSHLLFSCLNTHKSSRCLIISHS